MNEIELLRRLQSPFDNIQLILERPTVQYQIWAFVGIFLIAWLIQLLPNYLFKSTSTLIVQYLHDIKLFLPDSWQERISRSIGALGHVWFPINSILLGSLILQIFRNNGWLYGLLDRTQAFFWGFLLYRMLVALFYVLMEERHAHDYHYRLLRPLLLIISIAALNRILSGVISLSDIRLLTLADSAITLALLYKAGVMLYLFFMVSWVLRDMAEHLLLPHVEEAQGLTNSILTLGHYVVVSVGCLTVLATLGVDFTTLAVIGAGLSVGIGFGLQELFANFISGILLLFEQSIRPGDTIRIGENVGKVEKLRIRSTLIRTFDSLEIIIPNQSLLTSAVTNYTHTDQVVRARIIVRTSYQNQPQTIVDLLLKIVQSHESVRSEPEPRVFFDHFGESGMEFEIFVWLNNLDNFKQVPSELRCAIWDEFKRHKIDIPFPQRDLHLRTIDTDNLAGLAKDDGSWLVIDSPFAQEATGHEREN